jgi:hypothetical protein
VSLNLHALRECHTAPCLRCLAGCVCTVSQGAQLTAAGCTLVALDALALCTPVLLHCRGRREHRWRGNQAPLHVGVVSPCVHRWHHGGTHRLHWWGRRGLELEGADAAVEWARGVQCSGVGLPKGGKLYVGGKPLVSVSDSQQTSTSIDQLCRQVQGAASTSLVRVSVGAGVAWGSSRRARRQV